MNKCKYQIIIKDFPYNCCKAQIYCPLVLCPTNYLECLVYSQEYNTDKSAEHPTNKGEDIVRHSFEKRRVQDKELVYNNFESK